MSNDEFKKMAKRVMKTHADTFKRLAESERIDRMAGKYASEYEPSSSSQDDIQYAYEAGYKSREVEIEERDKSSQQVVTTLKAEIDRLRNDLCDESYNLDKRIKMLEHAENIIAKAKIALTAATTQLEKMAEALEYYSEKPPSYDVVYKNNYCNDDCPSSCVEHNFESKGKARPAMHNLNKAREATADYEQYKMALK